MEDRRLGELDLVLLLPAVRAELDLLRPRHHLLREGLGEVGGEVGLGGEPLPVSVELGLGEKYSPARPAGRLQQPVDLVDEGDVKDGLGQLDVPEVAGAPPGGVPAGSALLTRLERPQPVVHEAALDGHPILVVGLRLSYLCDRVLPYLVRGEESEVDPPYRLESLLHRHLFTPCPSAEVSARC